MKANTPITPQLKNQKKNTKNTQIQITAPHIINPKNKKNKEIAFIP